MAGFKERLTGPKIVEIAQTHTKSELENKARSHDDKACVFLILSGPLCPVGPILGYGIGFGLSLLAGADEGTASLVGLGSLVAAEATMLGFVKYNSIKSAEYEDALYMKNKGTK